MAPILGIPRMSSAFYRMRKFLECVEHMYGEVFVSTISLVFLLLMAFLKLVAKIIYQVCLVSGLPSRLRMYAVHTSPAHTCLY